MKFFISAIGTDSGKTLVSAIMVEALQADYWKPVQAGFPRDTETVKSLVSNSISKFYSEAYLLGNPMSPHAAADLDRVRIELGALQLPLTERPLIIEGAGGLLVPVNDREFISDLPMMHGIPIVLVANLYLGSINHTLLSIDYLERKQAKVAGIIFNGQPNRASEEIIKAHSPFPVIHHVLPLKVVNRETVYQEAAKLKESLKNHF